VSRRYGPASYLRTSAELARRKHAGQPATLLRLLAAKAVAGVSAFEYGIYDLHAHSIAEIRQYMRKVDSTALFELVNPPQLRGEVDDKLVFSRRCARHGLPTPEVLAVVSDGRPADGDEPVLRSFDDLCAMFAGVPRIDLILKPRRDSLGTGVRYVSLRAGSAFDIDGRPLDVGSFVHRLRLDMQRDSYLVQRFLRSQPAVASLGSGIALGSLRVLAMLEPDAPPRILYAVLRIPAAGNVHDNFNAGASGNLIAAVDTASGRLGPARGRRLDTPSSLLATYPVNPDTGARIEGFVLPDWPDVVAVVARAAPAFASLPCLGWDVAMTTEGVQLLEANSNPDLFGGQACLGMGARRWLAPLIERYASGPI